MFLVNGMRGKLLQYNRNSDESTDIYNDNDVIEQAIKLIPYDEDEVQIFDKYTHQEATGYYFVPRWVDVQNGDQIIFLKNRFDTANRDKYTQNDVKTVLGVKESWLYNRVEYLAVAIK